MKVTNKIKYFISDLDGTVIFHNNVKETDTKAFNDFISQGNHLFVATGRGTEAYAMLHGFGIYPEQMVCSSGAALCDANMNVQLLNVISHKDAKHLFNYLDCNFSHLDYSLDITDKSHHFGVVKNGNMQRHLPGFPIETVEERDKFFDYPETVLLRLFCVGDSNEYCYEVKKGLEKEFDGKIIALKTDNTCIDILPGNCGKWHGLETLLKQKNIAKEECCAIGDEETDIEMIKNCAIGFAMATADQNVKDSADYVVSSVQEAIDIINKINLNM